MFFGFLVILVILVNEIEPEEHEIINHMDLEKGKCYDTAELYRMEIREDGKKFTLQIVQQHILVSM